jgi:hypothetical protein
MTAAGLWLSAFVAVSHVLSAVIWYRAGQAAGRAEELKNLTAQLKALRR